MAPTTRPTGSYACLIVAPWLCSCTPENELQKTGEPAVFDTSGTPAADSTADSTDTTLDSAGETGVPTCPELAAGDAGDVAVVEACERPAVAAVTDPWSVREAWTLRAPSVNASATNAYATPVVGELSDDDGDGDIDGDDIPDVVVNVWGDRSTGILVALDGATGAEEWTASGVYYGGGIAVADVDADGLPDVLAFDNAGRVVAFEGDGSPKWTSTAAPTSTGWPLLSVGDLDEDGVAEVVADDLVLSGVDGSVRFSLDAGLSAPYRIAAIGDIDRDGDQEIALAGRVYDSDGTLLWDSGEEGAYGLWPFLVQADGDAAAEIGFVGDHVSLWEDDGTAIWSTTYGTAQPGAPCVGDLDRDGDAEVAWAAKDQLLAYELDGTPMWSTPVTDVSGLAACAGFDFDGDGALEVVFAGEDALAIFDGRTGAQNYLNAGHQSQTVFEYPTIADVDADGAAELVVASADGASWGALAVFEHDGAGWPPAGPVWPIHDFAVVNIDPSCAVPAAPAASWLTTNTYRARPATDAQSSPDLIVTITDVCVADCALGPVEVAVQVANQGALDVAAGVTLTLYADSGAGLRAVGTATLPDVPAGRALDGVTFELGVSDIGEAGWYATVDEAGQVAECDESNNAGAWIDGVCP